MYCLPGTLWPSFRGFSPHQVPPPPYQVERGKTSGAATLESTNVRRATVVHAHVHVHMCMYEVTRSSSSIERYFMH